MKILDSYKKMAKSMLIEHAWDRKFGEPLVTLEDVMKEAETMKLQPKGGGQTVVFKNKDNYEKAKSSGDYEDPEGTTDDDKEEPSGKLGGGDFERDTDTTGGDPDDSWDDEEGRVKPSGEPEGDEEPSGKPQHYAAGSTLSADDVFNMNTMDETVDDLDSLKYSGRVSDKPDMLNHIGDMVNLFLSGNAGDENNVDKAQEIADELEKISETNDEDPEAFGKLSIALQVGIDQHKKLKGESKTLEINSKKYKEVKEHAWDRKFGEPLPTLADVMKVKEEKKVTKKHILREMYEKIGGK